MRFSHVKLVLVVRCLRGIRLGATGMFVAACKRGDVRNVKERLVAASPSKRTMMLSERDDLTSFTPLIIAVKVAKSRPLAQVLLDFAVDVNECDSAQATPLYYAVADLSLDLVSLLLERGARSSVKTKSGDTPLMALFLQSWCANVKVCQRIAELLFASGAPCDVWSERARTPLINLVMSEVLHSSGFTRREAELKWQMLLPHCRQNYSSRFAHRLPSCIGMCAMEGKFEYLPLLVRHGGDMGWVDDGRDRTVISCFVDRGGDAEGMMLQMLLSLTLESVLAGIAV